MIELDGIHLKHVLLNEENPRLIFPMPKLMVIYFYHDDRIGDLNDLEALKKYKPEMIFEPTKEDLCVYRIILRDPIIKISTE